jgi:mono/diheme cytochrome c family protein
MKTKAILVLAAVATVLAIECGPARADDAKEGRRISKLWCSSCHVVANERAEGRDGPAFRDIAQQVPLSEAYMDRWLRQPRKPMHRFRLTPKMVSDIVAYLATLKKN